MFQWNKIITVDTDHIVGETKVTEQKDETGSNIIHIFIVWLISRISPNTISEFGIKA